jgi:glutamate carboxypeptidase
MSALINYFQHCLESTLSLIQALVERESMSRDEACLNPLARFVAEQLSHCADEVKLIPQSGFGMHLRARFGFGHQSTQPHLLILGHLDTVWPPGTLERIPFRVTEQGTAHGPGIFDMKSGVAIIIEALQAVSHLRLTTHHPVTLLLTCDEEIGSLSSRPLVEEAARNCVAAFVLEPPIPGGIVKTGRKGVGVFTLRVTGRAAHAGLDPSKGVNAIVELAHQIIKLSGLNDYERGITVNAGVIQGGTTSNVVPAEAMARVDVRFWTPQDGELIQSTLRQLEPVLEHAKIEVSGGINRPPMERSSRNLRLYEQARSYAAEIGLDLHEGAVGGGSDGNFTAAMGVPTLDGLGVDGAGAHAEHEHIIINDIPRRAALLTLLLTKTQDSVQS